MGHTYAPDFSPYSPLLLVLAAPARAAGPQIGIADDRILLAGGAEADAAVKEWQELGIQQVRIYALWSRIAPNSPSGEQRLGAARPRRRPRRAARA